MKKNFWTWLLHDKKKGEKFYMHENLLVYSVFFS